MAADTSVAARSGPAGRADLADGASRLAGRAGLAVGAGRGTRCDGAHVIVGFGRRSAVDARAVRGAAGLDPEPCGRLPPAIGGPATGRGAAAPNARAASKAGADGDAAAATGLAAIRLAISPRAPSLMIAGGAGLAILGFLLPWADYVLGASGMSTYFDRWGLAGPGHPIVLALVAVLAALALVEERLPPRARPRTIAVGIACLLIGLAWPYLAGPYNASLGIFFVTAGAILVLAGGLLGSAMSRHADGSANV